MGYYWNAWLLSIVISLIRVLALKKKKKEVRTKSSLLEPLPELCHFSLPSKGVQNTPPRQRAWTLLAQERGIAMITLEINKVQSKVHARVRSICEWTLFLPLFCVA
jgi:hypothetical protein